MKVRVEVCANGLTSLINAQEAGADCAELCESLEVGGLTPSYGTLKKVAKATKIPVRVLIRPRGGDYNYDENEMQVMIEDIQLCQKLGYEGIVIGILDEDNMPDYAKLQRLIDSAGSMKLTFHRAIDACSKPIEAVQKLIEMGFDKILTSGGKPNAEAGIPLIAELNQLFGNQINIMAGGGIKETNVQKIIYETKATNCHFSASETCFGKENRYIDNQKDATGAVMTWTVSSAEKIKKIINLLQ